jgi:glycosyltransferase involved in cell wall biosynthesis
MKKFSIIVPIFNIESYIGECVESVLSQSFKDYELILINDGSTDGSLEICKRLAESHNKITIINKDNGGVSSARNAGIDAAVGEYIIFLDGDDFWSDNKALEAINNIADEKKPDIITWGFRYLYKKDEQIIFTDARLFRYNESYGKKSDFLYQLIRSRCYTTDVWDKAVKRELILKNELYFKPLERSEDMEWSVRATVCADSFAWCEIPFQVYRMRTDSITHKFSHKNLEDAKTAFDICYNLIQKITDNTLKNTLLTYIANMYFTILCDIRYPLNKDKYVKLFKPQRKLLDYAQIAEAVSLNKWIKLLGFYPVIRIVRLVKRLRLFSR